MLLADVIHAVDALRDELLVFPAVLEDVPEHPIDRRDVGARSNPHIFGRVRRRARQPRVDHDEVGPLRSIVLDVSSAFAMAQPLGLVRSVRAFEASWPAVLFSSALQRHDIAFAAHRMRAGVVA